MTMSNCTRCGRGAEAFIVKRPGQPDRRVTTESAAQNLVRGVRGATYTPVGSSK
jgi:hypothetical protein